MENMRGYAELNFSYNRAAIISQDDTPKQSFILLQKHSASGGKAGARSTD